MQKGLQFTHANENAAQGDKPSSRPPTGSLKTEGDVMGGMLQADAANGIADVDLLG